MFTLLLIVFVIVVVLLIPSILLQSGSGAQSGIIGNDLTMGAFGAKSSEVLVKFTKYLIGAFLLLSFAMGYIKIQESKAYLRKQQQEQTQQDTSATPPADTAAQTNQPNTNLLGNFTNK